MTELIKAGLKSKNNRLEQRATPDRAATSELVRAQAPQPEDTPAMTFVGRQAQAQALAKLPPVETLQRELAQVRSLDDFFGKQGLLARLFASTISELMEAELTEHLGYERYSREGQGQGNSRNGKRPRTLHTELGDVTVAIPRDRNSSFEPKVLEAYQTGTNELEKKILYLYAKGLSTRDVEELLGDIYGVKLSATSISAITDKIKGQAEQWQRRPLAEIYPIIYLDALVVKLRREGKVENILVYVVLGIDLEGRKDMVGHWLGTGAEGAKFWLSVVSELQVRGVKDVFIACVDGLTGFSEAINAVFPRTLVQRCLVHQVRNSMRYVNYKDQKAFCADLKTIYQAPTRAAAEECLLVVTEKWGDKYGAAMRSWETNWEELAVMFEFPAEIRRLIYTTNPIESYNRQLRRVTKTKAAFPTDEAVLKLLYLAQSDITGKWTRPVLNWASILNQLAIYFAGRVPA